MQTFALYRTVDTVAQTATPVRTRPHRYGLALVALTAAVLFASCSSDDDAAPSTPAPATTPAATEVAADSTTPATEPAG